MHEYSPPITGRVQHFATMADGGTRRIEQMWVGKRRGAEQLSKIEQQAAKRATQLVFSLILPRLLGASGRPKLNSEIGRFTGS
jgi:hypothetical protein